MCLCRAFLHRAGQGKAGVGGVLNLWVKGGMMEHSFLSKFGRVGVRSKKPVSSPCLPLWNPYPFHSEYSTRSPLYPSPTVCFNATENHHRPCSASSSVPARPSSHVASRKDMSAHETLYCKTSSWATIALLLQRSHEPPPLSCLQQGLRSPLSHHVPLRAPCTKPRSDDAGHMYYIVYPPPHRSLTAALSAICVSPRQ